MNYFDTGNDPRLKFLEKYAEEIYNQGKSKKLPRIKREDFIGNLEKIVKLAKNIRWSYLTKEQLAESDQIKELINTANTLWEKLEKNIKEIEEKEPMYTKKLEHLINTIKTLPERIKLPDEPVNTVDVYYVKIISKEKHPKADKLWVTYVTDGRRNYRVVTNDPNVKPKDIVPMAYLPPREFMGVISEGMFVGGNGIRKEKDETKIGERPQLTDKEKNNVVKEIYQYIE